MEWRGTRWKPEEAKTSHNQRLVEYLGTAQNGTLAVCLSANCRRLCDVLLHGPDVSSADEADS